jgi:hypothetical protein
MQSLDEKTWNEFYLNDIFSFKLAKGDNQPKNMSQGRFPVVSAGETNNGVTAFVSNPDEGSIFQSGTITVDMFGKAFWHGYDYCAVSHGRVNILDLNTLNDSSQFISTCIDKGTVFKYSYNQMCSQKRLTRQKVMLPVTNSSKPDYDYMAQYASEMREGLLMRYKNYVAGQLSQLEYKDIPVLNEKEWSEFRLGDLFEVSRPKARNKDDYEVGDVPFVASGAMNNGVMKCCSIKPDERLDRGNCITVSPVDGSSFYQPMDFLGRGGAGSSILILRNNRLNLFRGEFMARMIQQTCSKYNYGHMENKDSIKRERVMLPVTDSGEPDYAYMEQYAKNMMLRKYQQYLTFLKQRSDAR